MDKNNKKLEHFFQSKLQNFNKEENWNTPPEFVWDSAKVSFPERKKKNRKFLFFMLFIGGVLLFDFLLCESKGADGIFTMFPQKLSSEIYNNHI